MGERPPLGGLSLCPPCAGPKRREARWQDRVRKCKVPFSCHPTKPTPARGCESMGIGKGNGPGGYRPGSGAKKLRPDADSNDVNDRRYQRKRSTPATVQGLACPERIAMLREAFPRLAWVEAYRDRTGQHWPRDRFGEITEGQIAELRSWGDKYGAMVLDLKRELCLIRWRTWLDSKFEGSGRRYPDRGHAVRLKARRDAKAAARRAESESPAGGGR